jgi:hypothetical protein
VQHHGSWGPMKRRRPKSIEVRWPSAGENFNDKKRCSQRS